VLEEELSEAGQAVQVDHTGLVDGISEVGMR